MSRLGLALIVTSLALGSGAFARAPCPQLKPGAGYPWQTDKFVAGDQFAWVYVDVDRTGRPIRCRIGENNIPDPETRFRLCMAYSDDWRGPTGAEGDPAERTLKRQTIMPGHAHVAADEKARRLYFQQHPDERPACYPE